MSVSELEADLSEDEHAGPRTHPRDRWHPPERLLEGTRRLLAEREPYRGGVRGVRLIQRSDTVYDGHNTYYLEPAPRDLDFSLLMAGDMLSPFIGEEEVDAQADAFSQWMMNLAYEEY